MQDLQERVITCPECLPTTPLSPTTRLRTRRSIVRAAAPIPALGRTQGSPMYHAERQDLISTSRVLPTIPLADDHAPSSIPNRRKRRAGHSGIAKMRYIAEIVR